MADNPDRNPDKVSASCPICLGTGFNRGKLCSCITGTPEMPGELKAIFGDVFGKGEK